MRKWVVNVLWLVAVWLAVTESLTVGAVVGGTAVATALMVLFPSQRTPGEAAARVNPIGLVRFAGYFSSKLVIANIHVAWAVLFPRRSPLVRGIVAVPIVDTPTTVTSVLASAVSLTPGTFIVEMREDPPVLYVHVLQLTTVDDVRCDVLRTQRAVVRALGPAGALRELDRRIAELDRRGGPKGSPA